MDVYWKVQNAQLALLPKILILKGMPITFKFDLAQYPLITSIANVPALLDHDRSTKIDNSFIF